MFTFASHQRPLPLASRVLAALFLLLWFPIYWRTWGPQNFFYLCDVALILGCLGLAFRNVLLISSSALSISLISLFWTLDVLSHVLFGRTLFGGTDYMFDPQYPLWLRLISLFHVVLPIVLFWALTRTGYDRRSFRFQCLVAAVALLASRACGPAYNLNYAFTNPFTRRPIGPAPIHLAVTFLAIALILFLPVHMALRKSFAPPMLNASPAPSPHP